MQYRIEKIGIHILAFLTGRCSLLGMYPFIVPFFMAAYLQEQSSVSLFAVLMLGVISRLQLVAAVKYMLVVLALLVLLNKTDRGKIFENNYQIALAAGVILWAVSMPYEYLVTRQDGSIWYALLEGVITASSVIVLEQGFVALRVGTGRRFATNERFVGSFAMMAIALFGCPVIETPFNLLFMISGYLLLYYTYRFESSVAVAAGSIAGLVLSVQTEHISWLAVMVILSSMLVILRGLGRVGELLGFLGGYLLLGVLYDSTLLAPGLLVSILAVSAAFLMTPAVLLKRAVQLKDSRTGYSQDLLIQEVTKRRIHNFGEAFIAMEKMLSVHQPEDAIPNGLSNMYLSGDGISLLNAVESQSNRLYELRRNFVRQLGQIGENIISFQGQMDSQSVKAELFEGRITEELSHLGVVVTKAVLVKDKEARTEVYMGCMLKKDRAVTGKLLAEKVGRLLSKRMVCQDGGDEVVAFDERYFTFVEEGAYMLTTGIVRKNREGEELCGDNFSVSKAAAQKAVLMLSDGMGSGESAYFKSEQIVELLEQLLSAGFCRELAIELLNSFISFLADGSISTTLDLTMIDLYTGTADFIKLGASTTFIKRGDRVECICSTSLPVGVLEQVEFDTCARKLYHGDMIVMVSDGVMDGIIFENRETYLAELIASVDTNNAQVMAEKIIEDIEVMQRGRLRDDSTILTAGVWENN
ncbi:MAG: SpoIIE family protein phosphatase [Lachnospiraceae bacterium]|nr:SpoIIE family protein phosphatase [Lachnospiraceae bacterium]